MATAVPAMRMGGAEGDPAGGSDEFKRVETRLRHLVGKAVGDYRMILSGDRIMVCMSGGSQEEPARAKIKRMLRGWEQATPGRIAQIFRGLQRLRPSHLADRTLFGFEGLNPRAAE